MSCPCCTPLTRLYLLFTEAPEHSDVVLQRLFCTAFELGRCDAVLLFHVTSMDRVEEDLRAAARIARGVLLSGYNLAALALQACDEVDEDAAKIGAVDAVRVEGSSSLVCRLYSVRALSECLPRGFTGAIIARYPWEVRLAMAALTKAGYRRILVHANMYDVSNLSKLFGVDATIETVDYIRSLGDAVDLVLVFDEELAGEAKEWKTRLVSIRSLYPCALSRFTSMVVNFWEGVFVEHSRLRGVAETLFSKRR